MSLYGKKANLVQERQEQEQLKEKYGKGFDFRAD